MHTKDYYKILGLDRNASQDAIRSAYRRLARRYHPDISTEQNAEDRFKELREAYQALKDPDRRAAYDRHRAPRASADRPAQASRWKAGFAFTRAKIQQVSKSRIRGLFDALFGGKLKFESRKTARFWFGGKDHHVKIQLDLVDAYRGGSRRFTLQIPGTDDRAECVERSLEVRIPKGIKAGQRIRLAQQGVPGKFGAQTGDLYLEIEFKAHPFFEVKGTDVYLDLPVAPWEAALGARIKVPTPDGAVELKIPPGSKQGARIRLKDRGIPGSPRGHFYVTLQIALPPANSEKSKRIYRTMAREFAFDPRALFGEL